MWWIGDWWIYGEGRYHADTCRQAAALLGVEEQTLKNAASVAGKFQRERRVPGLYFGHHDAVASLDAAVQDSLLALASEQRLKVHELRAMAAQLRKVDGEVPTVGTVERLVSLPLRFTEDRIGVWRQAAARDGAVDIREWIADVLDAAAAERLAA